MVQEEKYILKRDSPGFFWHKKQQTYRRTTDVITSKHFMMLQNLADDIIMVKLIVTSSYGEVSGPCAQVICVDTPNSPNFGLQ